MSPTEHDIPLVLVTCYNILNGAALMIDAEMYEVGGSSLQWCEGKMMPFSVGSYIMGPDTT
jgi:hypothetical protein